MSGRRALRWIQVLTSLAGLLAIGWVRFGGGFPNDEWAVVGLIVTTGVLFIYLELTGPFRGGGE